MTAWLRAALWITFLVFVVPVIAAVMCVVIASICFLIVFFNLK